MAGGAVFALPFVQNRPPKPPDQQTHLDPHASLPEVPTIAHMAAAKVQASGGDELLEQVTARMPKWADVRQSPFDELVTKPAVVPTVAPPEDILPMQPLRPWISNPPRSSQPLGTSGVAGASGGSQVSQAGRASHEPAALVAVSSESGSSPRLVGAPMLVDSANSSDQVVPSASPWREDDEAELGRPVVSDQLVDGGLRLPVDAWPDERYSAQQIARQVEPPKRELVSAIVPADQVAIVDSAATALPPPLVHQAPAITRQPKSRPVVAQVRFGQSQPSESLPTSVDHPPVQPAMLTPSMSPLPPLPDSRRQHVIFQPTRR
ncbi:MAG: XdhC family protein [Pirellulaceae bacterium]|nr:XdhC family protein [Pirellulaceae bacterium]